MLCRPTELHFQEVLGEILSTVVNTGLFLDVTMSSNFFMIFTLLEIITFSHVNNEKLFNSVQLSLCFILPLVPSLVKTRQLH